MEFVFVVFVFVIASAMFVSAQSNMNCSVYPRLSVPVDMVALINIWGNDSHAQYGNMTDYDYSVACKSNVTAIGYGCGDNFVNVTQLYSGNDSHVSVDGFYPYSVCLNTSNTSVDWHLDISARDATPVDYECVFAISAYNDSHVFECGNTGADYSVNIQLETSDTTPPTGSIVIFGPNGTEMTGTRNVFLNLSFSDNSCVGSCRFANDNESALNDSFWENCTTVKPWILSEATGNKTVYYEISDCYNNTLNTSDWITYSAIQDYTAPSTVVVYDSNYGYDVDWWNSNTSLSAYWFNGSDDISTLYYKYRILENGSCLDGDCSWTDVGEETEVEVTGLSLVEGSNYSFEVMVYTSSGLNSSVSSSNGTVLDMTSPSAPVINSTTHPSPLANYTAGNVSFNFTSSDVLSGIAGYSYLLDSHPGSAPDDNLEDRYWEVVESQVNNGHAQLLRANSSVASPNTYAVFSQLHENFTDNDSVRVRVALTELLSDYDDEMNVKVYLVSFADDADITLFDNEASAITTIANISRDISYAESMLDARTYEFTLVVNTSVNDNINDVYVVVAGLVSDNNNHNNLSIPYSESAVDNTTKNFVCDDADSCSENTSTIDYAIEVSKEDSGSVWDVQYVNIADGIYYFHVKAKDNAGNWGDSSHYKITIDTSGVGVDIISPFNSQVFTSPNITVTVDVASAANVSVVAVHSDGSNSTSAWSSISDEGTFNVTLESGTNRIYAKAVNPENGVLSYSPDVYVLLSVAVAGNHTLRVSYSGSSCSGHICSVVEDGAVTVGIATENDTAAFGVDDVSSDTGMHTIKIFATNPDMSVSSVESDLEDDDFLDRVIPMFGYTRRANEFVIRTEVRYQSAYLTGDHTVGPGKYSLVFKNVGTTPDGKANVSVKII